MEELRKEVIEPEIEKEVNEEDETNIEVPEEIKYNPYKYIRNYYERILPCMGSKCFSIACLIPISLIIPKIIRNGHPIRVHINQLLLTPPGGGKSSLCREFKDITYFPLATKKMTIPRIYHEVNRKTHLTLIIEDIATWFLNDENIKVLEGLIGEEESISHETMRNIKKGGTRHVNVVSFLCATPEVISNNRIQHGILRRTSPLIVYLTPEEHDKIIDYINDNMGKDGINSDSSHIKSFYQALFDIQEGLNKEIQPIEGYQINETIRENIKNFIKPLVKNLFTKYGVSSATETESAYRYLVTHAFLHVFRKKKEGKIINNQLVIDEEDLRVAKMLIQREIASKNIIMKCIEQVDYWNIRTREQLRDWEYQRIKKGKKPIPNEAKFVMAGLVQGKK